MVIDSSALVAIILDEPERSMLEDAIRGDNIRLISAVTKLDASMVLAGRRGRSMFDELDLLINRITVAVVPFDDHQADIARDAFARFGKGRHRAGLNFGDCAAYAFEYRGSRAAAVQRSGFRRNR